MAHTRSTVIFLLAVATVVASCSSATEDTTSTSTTTLAPATTQKPVAPTTTAAPATTATTPSPNLMPPTYTIVWRNPIEGQGDEVVVLLDVTSYDSLTDLDVFDLIADVVERFPPVTVAHIVDDINAAQVVADPETSDAERTVYTTNYLARLDEGFRITYLGVFADSGTAVLGS
ncbi:MAG: hypothetical protein ACR2N7_09100 [Acidimicrobiia bacterium]